MNVWHSVVPRSLASKENHRTTTDSDARRNLYVLGLPYDLTKWVHFPSALQLLNNRIERDFPKYFRPLGR